MKRKSASQSAFLNTRLFVGLAFCLLGVFLALLGFGLYPGGFALAQGKKSETSAAGKITAVPMVGPVSQDQDLRELPEIAGEGEEDQAPLMRHPFPRRGIRATNDPIRAVRRAVDLVALPTPIATFPGITSAQSACGCLPPDTNGDVGPNHYIQAVNSRFKIIDKSGNQLVAPTTYNSFFAPLGTSTPCGNQNGGDAVVFYDHLADRWVISDFAFPAFPGTSFYQCVGVSKTSDPVAGGWWLYALQVDPANPNYLGDYPKFGMWPDAYYVTMNLFSNNTTFNGVRVYALPRNDMINGTGAPNPGAIGFTLTPATLGDSYSLVPASFRTGSAPPVGAAEYLLAVNSSAVAGTVENKVFTWRFHPDFVTPANSTFGLGANHAPDAAITVSGFVDAFTSAGTTIVPQNGTVRTLDTLGDKIMYPVVYQNLGGTESLWAVQTVNNNQNGTGPTAVRWYQFNVTGGVIPAGPAQEQSFTNGADGLWRFMPAIAVDSLGNMAISYSVSSSTSEPSIRYAGRTPSDPLNTLAQGEAILQAGGGHQTSTSGRWGDYSALSIDPADNLTFWASNEYYSATSGSSWNTRIGNFKFPAATPQLISVVSRVTHAGAGDFDVPMPLIAPTGVEDRLAATYNIIFTFNAPVTSGTAGMTSGTGTPGTPTFNGNTMTVPLTGVTENEIVTLTVNNVNGLLPTASVDLGFLAGDSNGDRFTNVGDAVQVRGRSGATVDATNFRSDVNADGFINVGDAVAVRSRSGTALP